MADPEILYRGGEFDSLQLISGSPIAEINTDSFDPLFSKCGIALSPALFEERFRDSSGAFASVDAPDTLWGMCFFAPGIFGANGGFLTVFDEGGRPFSRLSVSTDTTISFQYNESATTSPIWTTLASHIIAGKSYIAFSLKFGPSNLFTLFVGGSAVGSGSFISPSSDGISFFRVGQINNPAALSQIQFSRNISLINARVLTRKANGAGSYQQMSGAFSSLVKTSIDDATGITATAVGQVTTNAYEDVTVPEGMVMHPDVWIWNRASNNGASPNSMKQALVIDGILVESGDLDVNSGFSGIPYVQQGMTPELFNGAQIGMKSSDV